MTEKHRTASNTYPQSEVSCFEDIPIAIGIVSNQSFVFQIKFSGKNSAIRAMVKR